MLTSNWTNLIQNGPGNNGKEGVAPNSSRTGDSPLDTRNSFLRGVCWKCCLGSPTKRTKNIIFSLISFYIFSIFGYNQRCDELEFCSPLVRNRLGSIRCSFCLSYIVGFTVSKPRRIFTSPILSSIFLFFCFFVVFFFVLFFLQGIPSDALIFIICSAQLDI